MYKRITLKPGSHPAAIILMMSMISGDVQMNPGPIYPCSLKCNGHSMPCVAMNAVCGITNHVSKCVHLIMTDCKTLMCHGCVASVILPTFTPAYFVHT